MILSPWPLHAGPVDGAGDPWAAWGADPFVLLGIAGVFVLYAAGWRRLRQRARPDLASLPQAACFALGLVVIGLALLSPLDHIGEEYLLSAHMVQHVLIGDVGPVLLVFGVAGPLALFVVPRPVLRALARPRPRAVLRVIGRPRFAFAVWVAVMFGWHLPVAFEYALTHRWAHDAEHMTMIFAGLGVWLHIAGVVPHARMSHARRAGYALALFGLGMVISKFLFLQDPLYSVYREQPERLLGLSPTADQTRAALIMTAEQMLTLVTAAALLAWAHLDRLTAERQSPGVPQPSEPDPLSVR